MKIEEPFHAGELEVQNRLGLRSEASQISRIIADSMVKNEHYACRQLLSLARTCEVKM